MIFERIGKGECFWIGVGVGFGVGAMTCYLYLKDRVEKRVAQVLNAEHARWKEKNTSSVTEEDDKDEVEAIIKDCGYSPGTVGVEEVVTNVADLYPPGTVEKRDDVYLELDEEEVSKVIKNREEKSKRMNDTGRPDFEYLTAAQFAKNELDYEQGDLSYYREDDVVVENGYEVPEQADILGENWKKFLGKYEPNAIYVRNNIIKTEYSVTSIDDFFVKDDSDL